MTLALLILGGVVLSMVLGAFWHSPLTPMGRLHMQYVGFDKLSKEEQDKLMAEMKPVMWKSYLGQTILSLFTTVAVVGIVYMSMQNGVPANVAFGFVVFNWLCFMVPVQGANIIWGNCDRAIAYRKFFYDTTFNLVTVLMVAGLVVCFV